MAWRWLLFDLVTMKAQAELPAVDSLTFGETLGGAGTFRATIPLVQPAGSAVTAELLRPPRAVFAAEKDDVIVWAGPIWAHTFNLERGTVDLAGETWLSYLHRRVVRATATFVQVDQALIAKTLVDTAQAVTDGNLGIDTVSYYRAHGVLRDRTYWDYEGKVVGTLLEQLGAVNGGFDLRFRPRWTAAANSALTVDLIATYPPTGRLTDLVFEAGATCEIDKATLDATNLSFWHRAFGKGEGAVVPTADEANADLSAAYRLLESTSTHGDVSETSTLAGYARRALDRGRAPIVIPEVVVDVGMLGQFEVGDIATVRVGYGLLQINAPYRVVGYSCDPPAGEVRVTLAPGEVFHGV